MDQSHLQHQCDQKVVVKATQELKVAQGMAAKVAQGMAAKVAQGMASEITQEVEPNYSYSDEDEDSSEEANQPDVYFKVPDQTCLLQGPRPDMPTSRSSMGQPDRVLHQLHPETGVKVNW